MVFECSCVWIVTILFKKILSSIMIAMESSIPELSSDQHHQHLDHHQEQSMLVNGGNSESQLSTNNRLSSKIDDNGKDGDDSGGDTDDGWSIKVSPKAIATINPIRRIVETMNLCPNKDKPFIPLSIGDPTLFGNFKPCDEILDSMLETITISKFNGYQPASGNEEARLAVVEYCSKYSMNLQSKDIILSSGCSHALDMAMSVLAQPGCNMLAPRPGFPLYKTLSTLLDIEIIYYNLIPEKNWQIDLSDLELKINSRTTAIIYNNPSNPCGSVFTENHIRKFLKIAEKFHLPVIADEIYENLVFPGHRFYAIASLTDEVPILHCSGTTKKFLIPGWRLGWIAINDKKDRFGKDIRSGLNSLSQRIIGPNSLIQGSLNKILTRTPKSFFDDTIENIYQNANLAYTRLKLINGLQPIKPQGAFYMMVRIEMKHFPKFSSDLNLVEALVSEQSVFCLPGACFEFPGYVRLVLAIDHQMLVEALDRIEQFFKKYYEEPKLLIDEDLDNED